MKSSRLMKYFEEYIKKFDMNNIMVKTKYFHSIRMMALAEELATNLNIFTEEEIVVCKLIALFHEIGGFETTNNYNLENSEEDYSMRSIEILFDEGLIRKITPDTKYDNIIKVAIYCHNKNGLPKNIDDKMTAYCNVIKDVHKIDTFKMVLNSPYLDNRIDEFPSQMAYSDFKIFRRVEQKVAENNADNILVVLSNLFDINYSYSYVMIANENYITKLIDSLVFTDNKIESFFKQIESVLNNYLKRKIGA